MLNKILVLVLLTFHSAFLWALDAGDALQTQRYTTVSLEPVREIKEPLDVVINITIPKKISLLGEAFEFLLLKSGYQIKKPESLPSGEMYVLFALPIPHQHREMGTVRLKTALEVLAGESYQIQINRVTRQIWFTLKDEHKVELSGVDINEYKNLWERRAGLVGNVIPNALSLTDSPLMISALQDTPKQEVPNDRLHVIAGSTYGPIISGETLGDIAQRIDAPDTTLSQRLIALFNENDHAFMGGNMNKLKVNEVIRIPSLEVIRKYDSRYAEEIQTKQFRIFLEEGFSYDS